MNHILRKKIQRLITRCKFQPTDFDWPSWAGLMPDAENDVVPGWTTGDGSPVQYNTQYHIRRADPGKRPFTLVLCLGANCALCHPIPLAPDTEKAAPLGNIHVGREGLVPASRLDQLLYGPEMSYNPYAGLKEQVMPDVPISIPVTCAHSWLPSKKGYWCRKCDARKDE